MTTSTPQNHIESFVEKNEMTIAEFKEVVTHLIQGRLSQVDEKIDGQNLTFTVKNGVVEIFSKGPTWKKVFSGGKTKSDFEEIYKNRPVIKEAFLFGYNCLQSLCDAQPEICNKLFQNGKVVVSSELVLESSQNLIPYKNSCIYFVDPFAMDPVLLGKYDVEAYKEFVAFAKTFTSHILFKPIPKVEISSLNIENCACLISSFDKVVKLSGANPVGNLGDVFVGLTKNLLIEDGMDEDLAKKVAERIARKDKKAFTHLDAKLIGIDFWKKIQKIEDSKFLEFALIPFENFLVDLAQKVFENVSFENSTNFNASIFHIQNFVSKVKKAYEEGSISASQKDLEEIKVLLSRIGDEKRFSAPTEGIVFKWNGNLLKLTGMFSSINKLNGLFIYGKTPAIFTKQ